LCAPPEDALDGFLADEVGRHARDGESGDGASAHGVNIGKRIGGGDAAVKFWIIDDGGEEISGLDKGDVIGQFEDTGIIGGG
jgi:hypothetical protein